MRFDSLWIATALLLPSLARAQADAFKPDSSGCKSAGCHAKIEDFHPGGEPITCAGCHGGNGTATRKEDAHVQATNRWLATGKRTSRNPIDAYGDLMREPAAYVRFVNPGDLRVAGATCGKCHEDEFKRVRASIMGTSANVPAAVLYDNGVHPMQRGVYGEAFTEDGTPARLVMNPPPTEEQRKKGAVPFLAPLARFEATSTPDIFRIFERGNLGAGPRGRGTDFKIAGAFLNLVKTRLNDPALWLPGTNGGAGDFRQSGCTACHVLYANDSDPATGGATAAHGNRGVTASADKSIPRGEPGHPIAHQLTKRIPVSQCLTCHHHQGNGGLSSYTGYIWHDQETEIDALKRLDALPGGAGQAQLASHNDELQQLRFADYHGHRWNFRAVHWTDRRGNLLDEAGKALDAADPKRFEKAVHLKDIHLEKGMQCVDCHLEREVHGDGVLYSAMIDAVEIRCETCHGTAEAYATFETDGAAAGPRNLLKDKRVRVAWETPKPRFYKKAGKFFQRSALTDGKEWELTQVRDVVDPAMPKKYNPRAARAMALKNRAGTGYAHDSGKMECYSCHSAWNTNCYGCHLPFDANVRAKDNHQGTGFSRGYSAYNPQVIRTDSYTLGISGDAQGNRLSPIRSASALVVSATDRNRNVVVNQQPTISSSGLSGYAITPNPPHTVRTRQTKGCSDCHVSEAGDNNAVMANLLGQGTNAANWVGDYVFVAGGGSVAGVRVTEGTEPRPVVGSDAHRSLHPDGAAAHDRRAKRLAEVHVAGAKDARAIAVVGEWALVADGPRGLTVYDTANIANKGAAQRLVKSPVTFLGRSLQVRTPDANGVALAASVPMDPSREPGRVAELFRYAFVADGKLGLVAVDILTLFDGEPRNDRLGMASAFNPEGKLAGARHVTIAGNYAYVSANAGLAVVEITDPTSPKLVSLLGSPLVRPRASAVQFRYAYVSDVEGVAVVDVTDPRRPAVVARVPMKEAWGLTPVRTWLYVAAGRQGLAILDVTTPARPGTPTFWGGGGDLTETLAVSVAATNASTFAYLADGPGGLKVVSLVEPKRVPGHLGFAPVPAPKLIATWRGSSPVMAVAEGAKRDRFVDESGNAIAVGGRVGSRPLNLAEMRSLWFADGKVWTVRDEDAPMVASLVPVALAPEATPSVRLREGPLVATTADPEFCGVLARYVEAAPDGFGRVRAGGGGLRERASLALPGASQCDLYLDDATLQWLTCEMGEVADPLQAVEVRRRLAQRVESCLAPSWSMISGVRLDGTQAYIDFATDDPNAPSLTVSSTRSEGASTVSIDVTMEREKPR